MQIGLDIKTPYLLLFFLNFISKIIFYKANTFILFLIERIVLAISVSGVSGCDSALLYSSVGEEKSEKAFAFYSSCSTFGFLIATLLSTFTISISMDFTVWITIFPYGIAVLLSLFLKNIPFENENKKRESIVNVLKTSIKGRKIIYFLISMALISEVSHSIMVFLNQLQYRRSGIDIKYYGIILMIVQIASMVSSQTHKITSKFGKFKTFIFIICSVAISSIVLASTTNSIVSILLIILIGIANSISIPISLDIQNKSITIANRATVLSVYAMIIDVISATVNLAIGKASSVSIQTSFILCGVIAIIALSLNIYYFKLQNQEEI
ncbi:MFS transporter [Clostridium beijerinckii]|uniref:MFS transporter n=1 Tax=Clostridium beijerinckii TaxID=1520 RepID=UPI0015CBFC8A|nr:MFS transporter [Clostridium beijerinckii]NOW04820.1 putative MFS family arabinose efflux permease [Clostridium beijerinckii]